MIPSASDSARSSTGYLLESVRKGGRFLMRAVALPADRMAARAVLAHERLALVDEGPLGGL